MKIDSVVKFAEIIKSDDLLKIGIKDICLISEITKPNKLFKITCISDKKSLVRVAMIKSSEKTRGLPAYLFPTRFFVEANYTVEKIPFDIFSYV